MPNEFSWSFSRHNRFAACKREYYLYHYGSQGGWLKSSGSLAQTAYSLKNLSGQHLWKGDVLHRAIERWLRAVQQGETVAPQDMKLWIADTVAREWAQSLERKPGKDRLTLIEHYYDHLNKYVTPSTPTKVAMEADAMLKFFLTSSLCAGLQRMDLSQWLGVEELETTYVDGIMVYVKIDFHYMDNGVVKIIDWKTGRKNPVDTVQLGVYGLHVREKYGVDLKDLHLRDVYLAPAGREDGGCYVDHPLLTEKDMDHTRKFIAASAEGMRQFLVKGDMKANKPLALSHFPKCDNKKRCERCVFFKMCEG